MVSLSNGSLMIVDVRNKTQPKVIKKWNERIGVSHGF